MKELTHRQKEFLQTIIDFHIDHGYYPSYRDLMRIFDFKSTDSVKCHIDALVKKGYIEHCTGLARTYLIIREPAI